MVIEIVADVRIVVIITGPIAYNSHHIRAEEIPVYSTGVNEIFSIIRSMYSAFSRSRTLSGKIE